MTIELSGIFQYPIKSISGQSLSETSVQPYGLEADRCMMLVDSNGMFISQRKHPQLALITTRKIGRQLEISAQGAATIYIEQSSFGQVTMQVDVWGDICEAFVAHEPVNQWFSQFLNQPVKLVKYNLQKPRVTDPNYSLDSDIVSFADGFPILLISESSLADLNLRLDQPITMNNFRPNLVVNGCPAFAEDDWKKIKIGQLEFDLVKQCSRCVLTTVDPNTGTKNKDGQPLKTLAGFRRNKQGVMFGMNLIPRTLGHLKLGDQVEILK
jgi:uncharacterized protein